MSTIGVGRAARDIDREGRRSRERREQRMEGRRQATRAAVWEDERGREATCTACGHDDDVASMFTASTGLVCASCFAADEGEIAVAELPSVWRQITAPAMYSPLLLPLLLHGLGAVNLFVDPLGWFGDAFVLAWIIGIGGAMGWIGILGLSVLESVRLTMNRADLPREERVRVVAGHIWHWCGLLAIVVGSFAGAAWLATLG